jgi:hypothetical protein
LRRQGVEQNTHRGGKTRSCIFFSRRPIMSCILSP